MVPHFTERVMECSEEELMVMADLVSLSLVHSQGRTSFHSWKIQKGIATARSDDTKSLKGVVLDWITPRDTALQPFLSRNVKTNRGFHHPVTGSLLCPAGLDWNDIELVSTLMSLHSCRYILMLGYAESFPVAK